MKDEDLPNIAWFDSAECRDVAIVGGKNASLGRMISDLSGKGIRVPEGFATTTAMYWEFVDYNNLKPVIVENMEAIRSGRLSLRQAGDTVRRAFLKGQWPSSVETVLRKSHAALCARANDDSLSLAVRSSATAEDLPEASFAGQQESFLNITGEDALLNACRRCFASLFTDRAITYRNIHHFDHLSLALSIGVQRMVRSDLGCAGVMFSIDTETGFDKVVEVTGTWGLGENIVQGAVDPDEYIVFKPLLSEPGVVPIVSRRLGSKEKKMIYGEAGGSATRNVETSSTEQRNYTLAADEVLQLARWAVEIELYYKCPMDMEWAKDGASGELFIVQARPETVQSQRASDSFKAYRIKSRNKRLLSGLAIGESVITAPVCLIRDPAEIDQFRDGSILVTENTDPDWVPVMKRAAAIITDHGGRTSHAAIVSRELGVPAVLGTGNATGLLADGQQVSVSCAEGDTGYVYEGSVEYEETEIDPGEIPSTRTQVMLNLANPASAFKWWRLPADGIGLVRMEFVINNHVRIHPLALLHFEELGAGVTRDTIEELTREYREKCDYFIDRLALGLARFAALYYPKPVIIRMSDFKSNEYAHLLGGDEFEPAEENPMLGFRGASRYYSDSYRDAFALECRAIRKIREEMGFANVIVMIPFCRTLGEARKVLDTMETFGLKRGENGLQVYVMCEIPANVILAHKFAEYFDGFSIGSNDLTQLTLGVDRDSDVLAELFSERDEAVMWMIARAISEAHTAGVKIGLCGQAPSDHPEFAEFLVRCGIDSLSVSPDSFAQVKTHVSKAENQSR